MINPLYVLEELRALLVRACTYTGQRQAAGIRVGASWGVSCQGGFPPCLNYAQCILRALFLIPVEQVVLYFTKHLFPNTISLVIITKPGSESFRLGKPNI